MSSRCRKCIFLPGRTNLKNKKDILPAGPDLSCELGRVHLENPVLTASGTAGHAAELADYFDISLLGAVVTKSVAVFSTPGNKAPRLVPLTVGMLNSVGLQGDGIDSWLETDLPALKRSGAKVICSVWGKTVADFAAAAEKLVSVKDDLLAAEINVSCPNVEDAGKLFSYSPLKTGEIAAALKDFGLPFFVKLSPAASELTRVAAAALENGAEGLVLVNTMPAMAIDILERKPKLGGISGGLSGRALHTVAIKAVYDCRKAFPGAPIIGVGGISHGEDAIAMMMAGANAVEVGTATLANPKATLNVLREIGKFCLANGIEKLSDIVGAACRD